MEILMKGMWRLAGLALAFYLFSASLAAQTPSTGGESCSQSANATQTDLNQCAAKELQKAESRLAALLKELGIDRNSPEQRAWEIYRDGQLKAIYPPTDNDIAEYGSAYPMCLATLKKRLTEGRIRDLKGLTTTEGDVCHGYRPRRQNRNQ
jgi:uncharacterized protein YecT (DUF1311 family)